VWREVASERARSVGLDPDGKPGAFLLRFEAGLRVGGEFKVRAPLAPQPGGGILFATPMEEGTVFHIMESDGSAQIESALVAATRAREALGGTRVAGALVFDCICRKLILEDSFGGMLRQVSESLGGAPLAGFETYGEIAMNSGDMSGFHNTTCVVLAFPEDD
jgi:methyl-accepting chemotaxis protein